MGNLKTRIFNEFFYYGKMKRFLIMKRYVREPFNGISHLIAAILSLIGLTVLAVGSRGEGGKHVSLVVYGTSLTLMMTASSAYHSIPAKPARIQLLRRIDHAAIFVLIAGTYTPICYNLFSGFWRWGLLTLIWGIAVLGIGSKIFTHTPDWLTVSVYLAMGWLSVSAVGEITRVLPGGAIVWLVLGGLIYTLGTVIYATRIMDFKPGVFGFHEIWHLFVAGGAFCHYILILLYVLPAPQAI